MSWQDSYLSKVQKDDVYRRWFGELDAERFQKVRTTVTRAKPADTCKTCFFIPGYLTSGVPADIVASANWYPGSKTVGIALYPRFWLLPFSGRDSQLGTLVHEYSHGYAATHDHRYGAEPCLELARRRPDLAVDNADSYQFYVEDLMGQLQPTPIDQDND